jgi:hypothetical protein
LIHPVMATVDLGIGLRRTINTKLGGKSHYLFKYI